MRRRAPRPLRIALERSTGIAAPPGLLAAVQSVWAEVAGGVVAGEAEPLSERGGVITIGCSSAVWAQELELLGGELRQRLNARLGDAGQVTELRFRPTSRARA